jgi:hypothetical protein
LLGLLTSDEIKTLTAVVGASTHGESFFFDDHIKRRWLTLLGLLTATNFKQTLFKLLHFKDYEVPWVEAPTAATLL